MAVNGKVAECAEATLVLTQHEAATLLRVAPRQLSRSGVPRLDLGRKRYLSKDVLSWLEAQRGSAHRRSNKYALIHQHGHCRNASCQGE